MTKNNKQIIIEYKPYDKYEGWSVRPAIVANGMQVNIGDELKIRCIKYRSQLENKLYLDKIIEVLKKENLL